MTPRLSGYVLHLVFLVLTSGNQGTIESWNLTNLFVRPMNKSCLNFENQALAIKERIESVAYRIYSINCPGRSLNFWPGEWTLIKFSPFSASVVYLFCNKIINVNNKSEDVTKQGLCKIPWRKLRLWEGLLLSLIWVCVGGSGVGWGGVGLGAYLLFLPLGWALIQINTVNVKCQTVVMESIF